MLNIKQIFKEYSLLGIIVSIALVCFIVFLLCQIGNGDKTDKWYPAVEPKPTGVSPLEEISAQTGQGAENMIPEPTNVPPLNEGSGQNDSEPTIPKPTGVSPLR